MPDFALCLDLKDEAEAIERYEYYHAHPFTEVVEGLKLVGILQLRIWRWNTRLFMVYSAVDGFDPATDFAPYLRYHPRCQEWENMMTQWQAPLPGAPEGEKWQVMTQVFELS